MTITVLTTALLVASVYDLYTKRKKETVLEESPYRFLASSQNQFNNFRKKQR